MLKELSWFTSKQAKAYQTVFFAQAGLWFPSIMKTLDLQYVFKKTWELP